MAQSDDKNYVEFQQAITQNNIEDLIELIAKVKQFDQRLIYKIFRITLTCGRPEALKILVNSLPLDIYVNHLIASDDVVTAKRLVESDAIFMNNYFANSYPLHTAITYNSAEICKYLIGLDRVDINKKNIYGTTPLQAACTFGHILIVKLLCEQSKIQINAITDLGQNAFHYACQRDQNVAAVSCLLNTSIDKNLKDIDGNSPFEIACQTRAKCIVQFVFSVSEAFDINIDDQHPHVAAFKRTYPDLLRH